MQMAETGPVERLQPFLLDRLTDDQPEKKLESRDQRVISVRDLRKAILRDLAWLLNTGCHPAGDKFADYPEVAKSVLNYGMPSLSGLTASGVKPDAIEKSIRTAIQLYEPRVLKQQLQVRVIEPENKDAPYVLQIEIRGEIWNLPMPEELFVRTAVDLDTGQWKMAESQ